MHAVRVFVSGRVQGVSYRYYTRLEADKVGAMGWVRNLPDGRVEAWFEGTAAQVEAMVKWCGEGSRMARVDKVVTEPETPEGYTSFEILR